MKNNLIWQKWGGNKRKTLFNSIFLQPTPRRPLPSYNAAQLTCVHRRRSSGDQNGLGRKINLQAAKKNILHFLIHLPLISTKEIFCTAGREVGCLCFGFLFKMGDSDNLSSGEAPEKPIKNSDIFFILFTEEGRNHYYYSGKKRLHDTHK